MAPSRPRSLSWNEIASQYWSYSSHVSLVIAMANTSITLIPKLIESVQSVVPLWPTDPPRSCIVTLGENHCLGIFRRSFRVVLCYKNVTQDDSGWLLAGWIKETLGHALLDQPFFAGRIRRQNGCDQEFEITSNDSGIRLIEARMDMNLGEFLNLEDKEECEGQLVHWENIDELNPQFSPLSYVQVTNFKCGGYSIGFSYSIILAEPLTLTSFIKHWANIHRNMVSKAGIPKVPLFHLPNIGKTSCPPPNHNGFVLNKNIGKTFIIHVRLDSLNFDQALEKTLSVLCTKESGQTIVFKLPAVIALYAREPSEEIKVKFLARKEIVTKPISVLTGLSSTSWDDFGAHEICIHGANRPTRVSSWISSIADEGLVMIIPYSDEGISGMKMIVTIPN